MVNTVSAAILDSFVGKNIGEICENRYSTRAENHCAHFVSHVLGLQIRTLCGNLLSWPEQRALHRETKGTGATTRCHELYNNLTNRGPWSSVAGSTDGILIFATSPGNVRNNIMANVPRKHVGIVCAGQVYNYGNTDGMVRKEPTVEAFRLRMAGAYHDPGIGLFYGVPQ